MTRGSAVIADVEPLPEPATCSRRSNGGLIVVLGSSAAAEEVDHYLRLLDATELVDHVTTAADVDRTKPDPDLIQTAIPTRPAFRLSP